MDIILIILGIVCIVTVISSFFELSHKQKAKKAREERRSQREVAASERSVEYFEDCRQKALEETSNDNTTQDVRFDEDKNDIANQQDTLAKDNLPSNLVDNLSTRIQVNGKLENFQNEAECQTEAILNLKKGDKLNLSRFGKYKIKMTTNDGLSIGFVDYVLTKKLLLMGIDDVRCSVRRIIKGKYGNAHAHLLYDVNRKNYERVSMQIEMKTSPMPREYFDLLMNEQPLGERRWPTSRQGSSHYFWRYGHLGYSLKDVAKEVIGQHIENKRYKMLSGESPYVSKDKFGFIITTIKGLNHRSEFARKVAFNLKEGDLVALVPDFYNEYHDSAHAVFTLSGVLIGYIDRYDGDYLYMDAHEILECSVCLVTEHISLIVNYLKK